MNKKIIITLFLCVFGLTSVALAKDDNAVNNQNKIVGENSSTSVDKNLDKKASSSDNWENKVEKLENRSKFKTFLIGTDYKTVGALRSEMVQTRNEIEKINKLVSDLATSTMKENLLAQLKALEETQTKIEQLVTTNENKFSLFGWLVKLFQK